jgi:CRISPR/Cas system-associated exonuclease Cas4 (RecB family)
MRLSVSTVKSLQFCGESFRLNKRERVRATPHMSTIAGTVFHEITEARDVAFALNAEAPTINLEEKFDEIYQREVQDAGFTDEQVRTGGKVTRSIGITGGPNKMDREWFLHWMPVWGRMYDAFSRSDGRYDIAFVNDPELGEIPAIEIPINVQIGGEEVVGYIDRVLYDHHSDQYVVMDLKTGAMREDSALQLAVYARGLKEQYGLDAYSGVYYMVRKGEGDYRTFEDYSDTILDNIFDTADAMIESDIFLPNPKSCNGCGYKGFCQFTNGGDNTRLDILPTRE